MGPFLIGLDFGTASARGVLVDAGTGAQVAEASCPYSHGTLTTVLPGGRALPGAWALQVPADYLAAAEAVLGRIGRGREVAGIGVGFTASSPMPARADGTALADLRPDDPHAYVKLWKHAAQGQAERLGARGEPAFAPFGGRVSGEWLLAKAMQVAEESPDTWAATERFVEAGDWLVWQLTGREARSANLAAYKAQWTAGAGYPAHLVPGLADRLAPPRPVGSVAGTLSAEWRTRTGIRGEAVVAVAMIDSHVVLPAVGAVGDGDVAVAMGTSAVVLAQSATAWPLPPGIEGVAESGALPGLWTFEAGQAAFGDVLAWLGGIVPTGASLGETLAAYDREAEALGPGRLLALDWWNGNRVPHADARLSGLILGLTPAATAPAIYRALAESVCFGTRAILDALRGGGLPVGRVLLTSGLAERSPFLAQLMADVLEAPVAVPRLSNATAVGAAIHGAVAGGIVPTFAEGAARFGAREAVAFEPRPQPALRWLYAHYRALSADPVLLAAMRALAAPGGAG